MAIIQCPECNNDVSTTAKVCPHCGYRLKKSYLPISLTIIAIMIICAIGITFFLKKADSNILTESKFNENTNTTLMYQGWAFSIPKCFLKENSSDKDTRVTYQLTETNSQGAVLVFDSKVVEKDDSYLSIGNSIFEDYSPKYEMLKEYYASGINGGIRKGKAYINNQNMELERFEFFDANTNSMIFVLMAQTYETEYNYLSDFEKIINSMISINGTNDTENSVIGKQVVISEALSIRDTPSSEGSKLGSAYNGDRYTITATPNKDWFQIDYKGKVGYVRTDLVTVE